MACGARDVHTEFELGRFFDDIQNRQQDARLANLVLHHLPSVTNLAVGLHQARALQQAEANLRKQLSAAIQRTTNSYGHVNAEHEQARQLLQRTLTGVKSFQQVCSSVYMSVHIHTHTYTHIHTYTHTHIQ